MRLVPASHVAAEAGIHLRHSGTSPLTLPADGTDGAELDRTPGAVGGAAPPEPSAVAPPPTGPGDRRPAPESGPAEKWDVQVATRDAALALRAAGENATLALAGLLEAPTEMAGVGGALATTVARALRQSMLETYRGNLTGCWRVADRATAEATSQVNELGRIMARAPNSLWILGVLLLVCVSWVLEVLLPYSAGLQVLDAATRPACPEGRHFLRALDSVGYLMAWHVVLYNYYHLGEGGAWLMISRWGALAVPWFFLVSGFVNTYSKLIGSKRDRHEDWFYVMFKKMVAWYPLFVLSLTICAVRCWSVKAEDWSHYVANMLLLHGLIWEGTSFPYMAVDLWLCYFMVYLLAWSPMHQVLIRSTNDVLWTLFTLAWIVVIPSVILEWIWFENFPLYCMIQYWPAFLFGQGMATWFVRNWMREDTMSAKLAFVRKPPEDVPVPVRFGATLGFLAFGILYCLFSPDVSIPLINKPLTPVLVKGALLPLQALMVAGLAFEVDPVAKLLARVPFCWGKKLTFTTFIFQVPVHTVIKDLTGWDGMTWTFSVTLLLVSVLGHFAIERPWRDFLKLPAK